MNLPSLPFLGRRQSDWDFASLWPSLQRARHCLLTSRLSAGDPHSAKVRISMTSAEGEPHLWIMVPRDSHTALDVAADPDVTLSFVDPRSLRLIHLTGQVALMESHHDPVYLHPSVQNEPQLSIVEGEQDFVMMRVDLPSDQRPRSSLGEFREEHSEFSVSRPFALAGTPARVASSSSETA